MSNQPLILVVDDEKAHRMMLRAHLEDAGYLVREAGDGEQALSAISAELPSLVLLDLVMPRMDGLAALERVRALEPELPVMMMTAYGSIESAVKALKMGAVDYLPKPLEMEEVLIKVERQLRNADLARRVRDQAERLGERFDMSALIGESEPMLALRETLAMVAPSEATVLIGGESGTGKEVVAQIIHQNSPRADGPLVKVNCAALPDTLLESELFGHEKGAFTGATARRQGRFKAADGGTLFLDEVGDMSPTLQAKLLRALQEGEYSPVGSDHTFNANVRVVAASNRDLAEAVAEGEFREDLFYRLNVVGIKMPPLRARGQDILMLAEHFLGEMGKKNRRDLRGFTPAARRTLLAHRWPGNVRELINAVERAVILAKGPQVDVADLPLSVRDESPEQEPCLRPGMSVREAEQTLITITLDSCGGNRTQAAQMLGITRKTLQNKIKEYGLPPAE